MKKRSSVEKMNHVNKKIVRCCLRRFYYFVFPFVPFVHVHDLKVCTKLDWNSIIGKRRKHIDLMCVCETEKTEKWYALYEERDLFLFVLMLNEANF